MTKLTFSLLVIVLCSSINYAEESMEIPLGDMWGIEIEGTKSPGKFIPTRPILQLADETNDKLAHYAIHEWVKQQPTAAIHRNLSCRTEFGPGFVVGSVDTAALLSAKVILCDGAEPSDTFSTNHALTLILYTGSIDIFDLKPVKRKGNRIEVEYETPDNPFPTLAITPRFAMIPLGKLPRGTYEVVIPVRERVCSSFKFQVE